MKELQEEIALGATLRQELHLGEMIISSHHHHRHKMMIFPSHHHRCHKFTIITATSVIDQKTRDINCDLSSKR